MADITLLKAQLRKMQSSIEKAMSEATTD